MFKNVAMVLFAIFLLIIALSIFQAPPSSIDSDYGGTLAVDNISRVGDYAYIILSAEGRGNITLLSYSEKPEREVYILNDRGIGMTRFDEFVSLLRILGENGLVVRLMGSTSRVNSGVYVVSTGAMPFYVFDNLGATNATILYIGKKNLFLEGGIVKNRDWYSELSETEKSKIIVYDAMLDEFLENRQDIITPIMENSWRLKNRKHFSVAASNRTTLSIAVANTSDSAYVRVVYNFGKNASGIVDSAALPRQAFASGQEIDVFPDEKFGFEANLNKTNGTVYVVIEKDGLELTRIREKRIIDEGVIYERFQFKEPGDYIIKLEDNAGIIGGTVAHVRDIAIVLKEKKARTLIFSVTIDGLQVDNAEVAVSLNQGTSRTFSINDGELSITARLNKGTNTFSFRLFGSIYDVEVENTSDELGDVYIKYGLPGLVLVAIVYLFARFSRRPTYVIRIGNIADDVRKEQKLSPKEAIDLFKVARKELGLTGPITPQEFGIILKRHFTEGADVTEGNVEEVLKGLGKLGLVEHNRGHYQLKGEGDPNRNVMGRIIREKLIERGINFTLKDGSFKTTHYEICFLGNRLPEKAIVVYDNETEFRSWFGSLSERQRAAVRIKQFNGALLFAPIDKIDDVL